MTETGLNISWRARRLEAADMAAVAELEALCFPAPWNEKQLTESLASPFFFIMGMVNPDAPPGQALAAYISLSLLGDEAEVLNIAVQPPLRRLGMGRRLLRLALRLCRLRGLERMVLEVRPSNLAALGLYESEGFVPAGLRRAYYRDNNEDALIMACDLKSPRPGR